MTAIRNQSAVGRGNPANGFYETTPIKRNRRSIGDLDALRDSVREVIGEYDGDRITIRHLFYRLVGRKDIEKTENDYKALCNHLTKWRKAGFLPYDTFIDGTRWHYGATTYNDADEALQDAVAGYRKNLWQAQSAYVEIWAEKDAIASIISPIASKWGLQVFICRGFPSISSLYEAGRTFDAKAKQGKECHILYLGDHDPSGKAIDADIVSKFERFGICPPQFERLAVTDLQISLYGLPTRPVKDTDKRAKGWEGGCVEVDTLTPEQIRQIITTRLIGMVDADQWEATKRIEAAERESLRQLCLPPRLGTREFSEED